MKRLFSLLLIVLLISASAEAQTKQSPSGKTKEWKNIVKNSPEEFYDTPRAKEIGENVLLYQRVTGGWPKNIPFNNTLTEEQKKKILADKDKINDSTTDNEATTLEMKYVAKMFIHTGDERYSQAFDNALAYLLSGQYESGGWPQFWPNPKGYQVHITFNDNSITNIMEVLRDILRKKEPYNMLVDDKEYARVQTAFDKGIECILKTQYKKDGKLTIWAQQYDHVTFVPAKARAYELPSLSPQESVDIVKLLMGIKKPSEEVKQAIIAAMEWFEQNKITGYALVDYINEDDLPDRHLVADAQAVPLWARYYDLETGKPFFCGRDGIKRASISDIELERRMGYKWYDDGVTKLEGRYNAWKKKVLNAKK